MTSRYVPCHHSRCHRCRDVAPGGGNARVPARTPHFRRSEPMNESGVGLWGSRPAVVVHEVDDEVAGRVGLDCWRTAAVRVRGCGALRRQLACRPHRVRRTCSGSDGCCAAAGDRPGDRRDPPRHADLGTRCEQQRWVLVCDRWHTGFVDAAGTDGLLAQVQGRASAAVIT
jgi:hypothetical protein